MSRRLLLAAVVASALLGCSSSEEDVAAGAGGEGGGDGGAGGAPVEPAQVIVSIVAEEGPGNGPALLRMANDTGSQILSLTLPTGEAFSFYEVQPGTSTEYAAIASADMLEDAILSLHTLDTCVRKAFSEMTGPMSLDPGQAYAIHIYDGFVAEIVEEEAPEPFLGLRAIILDPAISTSLGAASNLYVSGIDGGEVVFESLYDEPPAPFVMFDVPSVELSGLRFVDKNAVEHSAQGPFMLDGAFGFTFYVQSTPVEGAAFEIVLE